MKIIECPRDAWQGLQTFIPTSSKIEYLNLLLRVGFDTIDFGSFVSPKAMMQVSDTAALTSGLDLSGTATRLLAIVANERGAADAARFEQITYLGFPFSISETFQQLNTNSGIAESADRVGRISEICAANGKTPVIYISMGFGNPYGDPWHTDLVLHWVERLSAYGIKIFSLADTVGLARPEDISLLFSQLITFRTDVEFGAHFHTAPDHWQNKIDAAYQAGCRRFDGALSGYGGCPMAQDELVGNMPTEHLFMYGRDHGEPTSIDPDRLFEARELFLHLVQK